MIAFLFSETRLNVIYCLFTKQRPDGRHYEMEIRATKTSSFVEYLYCEIRILWNIKHCGNIEPLKCWEFCRLLIVFYWMRFNLNKPPCIKRYTIIWICYEYDIIFITFTSIIFARRYIMSLEQMINEHNMF